MTLDTTALEITYKQLSSKNLKVDFEQFLIVLRRVAAQMLNSSGNIETSIA